MVIKEVEVDRNTILTIGVSTCVVENHLLGKVRDIEMHVVVHVFGFVVNGPFSGFEWISIIVRAFDLELAGNGRG